MKKLFAVLRRAALITALAALVAAFTAVPASAANYYKATDYDIKVNVSESNAYDVTEVITVQYTQPQHGIYRKIPFQGTWLRATEDGGNIAWKANISNIHVDDYKYSVSKSDGDVVVKIGDADKFVTGTQVYRISYRIQFYDDGLPNADEVYYNLIGTKWESSIDHVTFSVTLPKSFDSKPGFSIGTQGTSGYDPTKLSFSVDGNTIKGAVKQPLSASQGVTIRLQLPQGYFKIPFRGTTDIILIAGMAVLVLLAYLLLLRFGRDEKLVKTVEFYAPDGMTPSEVGYIIDGVVDDRDVVSLIIYWAHRSYLSIDDTSGSSFTLHKLRDIDPDAKDFEKHMFNELFKNDAVATSSSLRNTFYKTIASTKSMVSKSFESDNRRVFTKASMSLRPLISFFTALPVMITLLLTNTRSMADMTETLFISILLGILIMIPVSILVKTLRKWRGKSRGSRIAGLLVGFVLSFAAMAVFVVMTLDNVYVKALPWCAVLATILLGLAASFIEKRTPQGTEWLGKIYGFRDFLELAERDKLVALVEQDPKYFYNILPYAWVLNVSDKWAKKFETIAIQPPDWYYGRGGMFYPVMFMHDLNRSMNTVQSTMISSPSSSGSGGGGSGFSGGGFSGGGGGGGGGGSW